MLQVHYLLAAQGRGSFFASPIYLWSSTIFTVAEHIIDSILFDLAKLPLVKSTGSFASMYAGGGGMGGGGNAWMKIMGIDQDKVKARHLQAEKEAKIKAKEGKGTTSDKDDIEIGEALRER